MTDLSKRSTALVEHVASMMYEHYMLGIREDMEERRIPYSEQFMSGDHSWAAAEDDEKMTYRRRARFAVDAVLGWMRA